MAWYHTPLLVLTRAILPLATTTTSSTTTTYAAEHRLVELQQGSIRKLLSVKSDDDQPVMSSLGVEWGDVRRPPNEIASSCYHCPFEGDLPNVNFGMHLLSQRQDRWHLQQQGRQVVDPCCNPVGVTNVSCWGVNISDSTPAVQAALDCGSEEVVIPLLPGNVPWVVTPLLITGSNLTLTLQPGVVVQAKKGSFLGKGDSLLSIVNASNVTLRAHGATLQMRKMDYLNPPYRKGEWRMGIKIIGSRMIHITGVTVNQSGGDGLYIGGTVDKGILANSVNVTVTDMLSIGNNRQGLSICAGQNILVKRSVFAETNGTGPSSGGESPFLLSFIPSFATNVMTILLRLNLFCS
eukprot:COSAG05_NODE_2351_length_3192_cov_2.275137_3_plen_350_part_00